MLPTSVATACFFLPPSSSASLEVVKPPYFFSGIFEIHRVFDHKAHDFVVSLLLAQAMSAPDSLSFQHWWTETRLHQKDTVRLRQVDAHSTGSGTNERKNRSEANSKTSYLMLSRNIVGGG
jgi:hypothetical protein